MEKLVRRFQKFRNECLTRRKTSSLACYRSSTATIEYAMAVLKTPTIVCGHIEGGAMKALLHPEKVPDLPIVKE